MFEPGGTSGRTAGNPIIYSDMWYVNSAVVFVVVVMVNEIDHLDFLNGNNLFDLC